MECQGARSDAEVLSQLWTDWAVSADNLMLRVTEFACQQEQLVRQVFARCPQMDGNKDGEAFRDLFGTACVRRVGGTLSTATLLGASALSCGRPLGEQEGEAAPELAGERREKLVRQVLASCPQRDDTEDCEAFRGLVIGAQAAAAPCLETGAVSCGEPSGAQAAEVARPEPTDESRESQKERPKRRTTRTSTNSRGGHLRAYNQRRTDQPEERWEAIGAWQSRYDDLTGEFIRRQRVDRLMPGSVADILPARALHFLDWWQQLEEPPRRGFVHKIVSHRAFNNVIGLLILMNTFFAVFLSDYGIENVGQDAPNETAVEGAFLFCFAFEMCLKIWVHKLHFFCNDDMIWSMFDFVLVIISTIDLSTTIAAKTASGDSKMNVTFARVLRIFKAGRILRVFRAVKFLNKFRVILTSIVQSFSTFGWSVIVMTMLCFTFSLLFVQQIGCFTSDAIRAGSLDDELWAAQQKHFGSVSRGTFTLLMVAMGGASWGLAHDLIEPLGWMYNAAFMFFVIFFNFAIMTVLSGMFLDTVLRLSKPDREEQILEDWEKKADDFAELTRIVEAMDVSHSGAITKESFVNFCNYPLIQLCFAKVGIDVGHPEHFFLAAADGADAMGVQEFVEGAVRMKGSATNVAIQCLVFEVRSLVS